MSLSLHHRWIQGKAYRFFNVAVVPLSVVTVLQPRFGGFFINYATY
ncbi:hypothetical protein [Escherichia coli ISC7]|uniref:Uncharacterized protein n=1 Tax=Escherichia coli ISC7 TaxID=1432555 RepID=W1ERB0_ECOLX|nr:hypothetical protein [Escherichia coli ISC7]